MLDRTVLSELRKHEGHVADSSNGIVAEYLADMTLLNLEMKIKYSSKMIA